MKRFRVFFQNVGGSETHSADREPLEPIALNIVREKSRRIALFNKPDTNEQRLAATFMAALTPPQSSSQRPYLLTDLYYGGHQEDAQEFISRLLFSQDLKKESEKTLKKRREGAPAVGRAGDSKRPHFV